MLTIITAMALAAAAQNAPANAAAEPMAMGEMQGMDMSHMDHSKMGHMAAPADSDSCCKHTSDGKMDCAMDKESGSSTHDGHDSH